MLARKGKQRISAFFTVLILSFSSSGATSDTVPFRHNKIQIDPVSLLTGSFILNYECRVTPTHAFALEGAYTFPLLGNTLWMGGVQYRHYYSPKNFWGIFANKGESSVIYPSTERGDTSHYTIQLSFLTIGANWGRVWHIKKRFPIIFRIGAGYPVTSDVAWKNGLAHPEANIFEGITRFSAALDSELSIGVSF